MAGGDWNGLDSAAWGSHVYYSIVAGFAKTKSRPITLSKFAAHDGRPDTAPDFYSENPAQHRYPIHWTGDNVNLQASVETMVDAGIHSFKPYVHSDCGKA